MMSLHVVLGPLAALSVLMVTTGLALAQGRTHLARRLAAYTAAPIVEKRPQRARVALRDRLPNVFGRWQAAAAGIPLLNRRATLLEPWLARQLVRASISITPRELELIAFGIVSGGMALGLLLWGTATMAIIAAVAGLAGLAGYVRYKQRRRLRTFGEQLPEVLAMLVISLRAGFSVMQALDAISKQIRAPAALELATVIREIRLGVAPEQALKHLATRVANEDLHLLVNAITIQRETGGNLVSMVETIEETVRERVKIRGEVRTLTAQAALGGWVITLLPVVLGAFLYLINPSGMSFFWSDWLGVAMGGMAVFNVALGNIILRRITKIEL